MITVPAVAKAKPAEVVVPAGAVPAIKVLPPPSFTTGAAAPTPAAAPATPAPAAATTEAAPACKVPLVNGVCPPGN